MRCSICGKEGHNARTCPNKEDMVDRSHALWVKVDNITRKEASDLQIAFQKDKERIAPHGRGTAAKGAARELPDIIRKNLALLGGHNDKKKG